MEALFLRVAWISLTCSAVLLPLLVGKGWLRRHVRAKALYVVWLVLALRLVIPVDLSLPEPVVTVEAPEYQIEVPVQRPSAPAPLPSETAEVEEPQWEFPVLVTRIVPVTVVYWQWLWSREAATSWPGGDCCGMAGRRSRRLRSGQGIPRRDWACGGTFPSGRAARSAPPWCWASSARCSCCRRGRRRMSWCCATS